MLKNPEQLSNPLRRKLPVKDAGPGGLKPEPIEAAKCS